jgi:hypothetical protein
MPKHHSTGGFQATYPGFHSKLKTSRRPTSDNKQAKQWYFTGLMLDYPAKIGKKDNAKSRCDVYTKEKEISEHRQGYVWQTSRLRLRRNGPGE